MSARSWRGTRPIALSMPDSSDGFSVVRTGVGLKCAVTGVMPRAWSSRWSRRFEAETTTCRVNSGGVNASRWSNSTFSAPLTVGESLT